MAAPGTDPDDDETDEGLAISSAPAPAISPSASTLVGTQGSHSIDKERLEDGRRRFKGGRQSTRDATYGLDEDFWDDHHRRKGDRSDLTREEAEEAYRDYQARGGGGKSKRLRAIKEGKKRRKQMRGED